MLSKNRKRLGETVIWNAVKEYFSLQSIQDTEISFLFDFQSLKIANERIIPTRV